MKRNVPERYGGGGTILTPSRSKKMFFPAPTAGTSVPLWGGGGGVGVKGPGLVAPHGGGQCLCTRAEGLWTLKSEHRAGGGREMDPLVWPRLAQTSTAMLDTQRVWRCSKKPWNWMTDWDRLHD